MRLLSQLLLSTLLLHCSAASETQHSGLQEDVSSSGGAEPPLRPSGFAYSSWGDGYSLATNLEAADRLDEADAVYTELVETYPSEPGPYIRLGTRYRLRGEWIRAIDFFRVASLISSYRDDRAEVRLVSHVNTLSSVVAVHAPVDVVVKGVNVVMPFARRHPLVSALLASASTSYAIWELDQDAQRVRICRALAAVLEEYQHVVGFNDPLVLQAWDNSTTLKDLVERVTIGGPGGATRAMQRYAGSVIPAEGPWRDALQEVLQAAMDQPQPERQKPAPGGRQLAVESIAELIPSLEMMKRMFELVYAEVQGSAIPAVARIQRRAMRFAELYPERAGSSTLGAVGIYSSVVGEKGEEVGGAAKEDDLLALARQRVSRGRPQQQDTMYIRWKLETQEKSRLGVSAGDGKQASIVRTAGRPQLRTAYVSSDFRMHSVGFAIHGMLAGHNRSTQLTSCYNIKTLDRPEAVKEHQETLPQGLEGGNDISGTTAFQRSAAEEERSRKAAASAAAAAGSRLSWRPSRSDIEKIYSSIDTEHRLLVENTTASATAAGSLPSAAGAIRSAIEELEASRESRKLLVTEQLVNGYSSGQLSAPIAAAVPRFPEDAVMGEASFLPVLHRTAVGSWTQTERLAYSCDMFLVFSERLAQGANDPRLDTVDEVLGKDEDLVQHVQESSRAHVVIDLNGRSAGERPGIWLQRPAPVTATYMGSPITTASREDIDYLITDAAVAPPEHAFRVDYADARCSVGWCPWLGVGKLGEKGQIESLPLPPRAAWPAFSENVVYIPAPYHAVTATPPSYRSFLADRQLFCRAALGQEGPAGARQPVVAGGTADKEDDASRRSRPILASAYAALPHCRRLLAVGAFHSITKVEPHIFASWLNILQRSGPCTVLLLLKPKGYADIGLRLQQEAAARGIHPERVRLVGKELGKDSRLSMLPIFQQLDLFLDARIYGAHSTAVDILSSGVPLLTVVTSEWAGRVAADMLQAMTVEQGARQLRQMRPGWKGLALDTVLVTHSLKELEDKAVYLLARPLLLLYLRASISNSLLLRDRRTGRALQQPLAEPRYALQTAGTEASSSDSSSSSSSLALAVPDILDFVRRAGDMEAASRAMVELTSLQQMHFHSLLFRQEQREKQQQQLESGGIATAAAGTADLAFYSFQSFVASRLPEDARAACIRGSKHQEAPLWSRERCDDMHMVVTAVPGHLQQE